MKRPFLILIALCATLLSCSDIPPQDAKPAMVDYVPSFIDSLSKAISIDNGIYSGVSLQAYLYSPVVTGLRKNDGSYKLGDTITTTFLGSPLTITSRQDGTAIIYSGSYSDKQGYFTLRCEESSFSYEQMIVLHAKNDADATNDILVYSKIPASSFDADGHFTSATGRGVIYNLGGGIQAFDIRAKYSAAGYYVRTTKAATSQVLAGEAISYDNAAIKAKIDSMMSAELDTQAEVLIYNESGTWAGLFGPGSGSDELSAIEALWNK